MSALHNPRPGKGHRLVVLRELVGTGKICAGVPSFLNSGKTDVERIAPLRVVSLNAGEVEEG